MGAKLPEGKGTISQAYFYTRLTVSVTTGGSRFLEPLLVVSH